MIRCIGDKVCVKKHVGEAVTPGGIHLPDTAKEQPNRGIVVSAGPDVKDPDLKDKATVLFGRYSGSVGIVDGEEYLFLTEQDVLAVVTPD